MAYTTNSTDSIDFVMDVNGGRGPNKETIDGKYYDIRPFRVAHFDYDISISIPPTLPTPTVTPPLPQLSPGTGFKALDCEALRDNHGSDFKYCYTPGKSSYGDDAWVGARKACDEMGMRLPTVDELQEIVEEDMKVKECQLSGCYWTDNLQPNGGVAYSVCTDGSIIPNVFRSSWAPKLLCVEGTDF